MKKALIILLFFSSIVFFITSTAVATNIALNKPVTLSGIFGMAGFEYTNQGWGAQTPLASSSTITDGVFLDENHQWNYDTVWWDESVQVPFLDIDLGGDFLIDKLVVQADNNDEYIINLFNDSVIQEVVDIPSIIPEWGMITREISLSTPVLADLIRFGHYPGGDGDYLYSVSEIQAFNVVPEPTTMLLLSVGLIGLAGATRRKLKK